MVTFSPSTSYMYSKLFTIIMKVTDCVFSYNAFYQVSVDNCKEELLKVCTMKTRCLQKLTRCSLRM